MKKILTVSIIVCMIFVSLLAFSSCSIVTDARMKLQGQEVVSNAVKNTTDKFFSSGKLFSSDKRTREIVEAATETGSVEIDLESDLLESSADIENINYKTYFDKLNKKSVTQMKVTYDDEEFALDTFVDKNGYVISGESVLGSDQAYAIYPATLSEKLIDSDLGKMLFADTPDEELESIAEVLEQFAKAYKEGFETDEEEQKAETDALWETLNPKTESVKITNANGKEITAVVVTYTINNTTIEKFLEKAYANAAIEGDALEDAVDGLIDALDDVEIDLKLKYYLNFFGSAVEQIELVGDAEINTEIENYVLKIDALVTFSKNEIKLTADMKVDGEKVTLNASVKKETSGDETKYVATLTAKSKGVTVDLIEATLTYNEETGAFKLVLSTGEALTFTATGDEMEDYESEPLKLTVKGTLKTNEDSVSLVISSLRVNDESVDISLKIIYKESDTMPAFPAEVKDVVDMTEEDMEQFVEDFEKGTLGKLIANLIGQIEQNPII